jgi:hypothetical protein
MSSLRDLLRKRGGDGATPGVGGTLARYARALVNDLVDKNLWPVALLLCVAIVAIPILLSRGAGSDGAAGVPVAAPPADVDVTNVFERVGPPTVKPRSSQQQDPFRQPAKKKDKAAGRGAMALGADAPSPAAQPAASPATAPPSGSRPPAATPAPKATPSAARVYYRSEVRWSQTDSGPSRPLTRLTPLGDVGDRAALYLGVSAAGFAVFLLSPNAVAEGMAGCEELSSCRVIGLQAGATQVVALQPPDGGKARRYYLEAVSVKRVTTTLAAARTMRAKVHSEGRAVMRALWADGPTAYELGMFRYDRATGLLVESGGAKKTTR